MRGDARLTRAINRSLMGWWKHDQEQGDAALLTLMSSPREGTEGTSRTLHPRGHASRPGSPGVRVSEGHLQLTENVLCEQRRNLKHLPRRGRRADRQ